MPDLSIQTHGDFKDEGFETIENGSCYNHESHGVVIPESPPLPVLVPSGTNAILGEAES